MTIEKISEIAEPPKIYPLAGPCVLVHVRYKCTICFALQTKTCPPKAEVIFIDKDYLRRLASEEGPAPTARNQDRGTAASLPAVADAGNSTSVGQDKRLLEVEKKLDLILKALETPRGGTPRSLDLQRR